ncbi:MAG: T9SS type A sorting domain-containing protein [Ignavibacteria bacterium]|nr:T9SS type A sorting domain-containing protein [Ignavibacteria bacterium]
MKKYLKYLPALLLTGFIGYYFIYTTTIMYVQTVPMDSLVLGRDRSLRVGDTVTVTGKVVAPAVVNASGNDFRILLRGTNSRTIYIQDTTNSLWGGIIVRQADTVSNTGITTLDSGMKVTLTGIVQEFPDIISSGATQLKLDTLQIIQVLPTIKRRPAPITVNVSDFDSAGGNVKFTTGEKYEGMHAQINNVTIGPQSPLGLRNIRRLIDAQGNFIYLRDFSNFFSVSPSPGWGWTAWTPPSIGASVNYIRGVIINSAYADGNGGLYPYVIVPIYPNDFSLGNTPPFISNVSRIPCIPKPADSVQINVTVVDTLYRPMAVDSVQLFYRVNRGPYIKLNMNQSGPVYFRKIGPQSLGTLVEYFIKAVDNQGAVRLSPSDTNRSTYFYYVKSSDTFSIREIQYTPNRGGFSGYVNCEVITEGVVTCDTSDIPAFSFSGPGGTQTSPRRVIIQDPNISSGWSGIWITGNPTDVLQRGQRVRVKGTVEENFGMTRINIATPGDIQILGTASLPPFQDLTPGDVANSKVDGDTTAEKWESVLIRFPNQVVISCVNASSQTGCTSEFPLPDTAFRRNFGEIFVVYQNQNIEARVELQDGSHNKVNGWDPSLANYYNQSLPGHLLWRWDGISYLRGVLYFAFDRYKLVPRKNDDFGNVIAVEPISNEFPSSFWLKQNFPNPFNPSTNIVYNIPSASVVTLKVYNLIGQEVMKLVDGIQNIGKYEIKLDASKLASGMYIYVLEAVTIDEGSKFKEARKMVVIR